MCLYFPCHAGGTAPSGTGPRVDEDEEDILRGRRERGRDEEPRVNAGELAEEQRSDSPRMASASPDNADGEGVIEGDVVVGDENGDGGASNEAGDVADSDLAVQQVAEPTRDAFADVDIAMRSTSPVAVVSGPDDGDFGMADSG